MSAVHHLVLSQYTHLTDRQTDRQNCDSNTVRCITCSRTVKTKSNVDEGWNNCEIIFYITYYHYHGIIYRIITGPPTCHPCPWQHVSDVFDQWVTDRLKAYLHRTTSTVAGQTGQPSPPDHSTKHPVHHRKHTLYMTADTPYCLQLKRIHKSVSIDWRPFRKWPVL